MLEIFRILYEKIDGGKIGIDNSQPPAGGCQGAHTAKKKLYKYPTDANPEPRKVLAWQSRVKTKRSLTEIYKPDHLTYGPLNPRRFLCLKETAQQSNYI